MNAPHADTLVFFGATGDLAYKKIFPALHAMAKRGNLNVPVIGTARSAIDDSALRARARKSIEEHGGIDPAAFEKLAGLMRYVRGDTEDPTTYQALHNEEGSFPSPCILPCHSPAAFIHLGAGDS